MSEIYKRRSARRENLEAWYSELQEERTGMVSFFEIKQVREDNNGIVFEATATFYPQLKRKA